MGYRVKGVRLGVRANIKEPVMEEVKEIVMTEEEAREVIAAWKDYEAEPIRLRDGNSPNIKEPVMEEVKEESNVISSVLGLIMWGIVIWTGWNYFISEKYVVYTMHDRADGYGAVYGLKPYDTMSSCIEKAMSLAREYPSPKPIFCMGTKTSGKPSKVSANIY